jgi:hypothetical protein
MHMLRDVFMFHNCFYRASVVEIIVLVSNGVVFQNDNMSSEAKNTIGGVMIFVVICLMVAGFSGEFMRRVEHFTKKRLTTLKPQTTEMPTTSAPLF